MSAQSQNSSVFQSDVPNFVNADNLLPFGRVAPQRATFNPVRSTWMQKLNDRFNELTALQVGWDGYNGRPVSFNCAMFAANMLERLCSDKLPAPSLVPGGDGTLQIEWHINQYDLEIDVLAPFNVIATRYDHETGHEEEVELQSDFSPVVEWIIDLASVRGTLANSES